LLTAVEQQCEALKQPKEFNIGANNPFPKDSEQYTAFNNCKAYYQEWTSSAKLFVGAKYVLRTSSQQPHSSVYVQNIISVVVAVLDVHFEAACPFLMWFVMA
jgi:hypothetical protein